MFTGTLLIPTHHGSTLCWALLRCGAAKAVNARLGDLPLSRLDLAERQGVPRCVFALALGKGGTVDGQSAHLLLTAAWQ